MMSKDQIRRAVLNRLEALQAGGGETHLDHNDGVLRGLLWAMSGEDPGTYLSENVSNVLTLAGIPWRRDDSIEMIIHAEPGDSDWPMG